MIMTGASFTPSEHESNRLCESEVKFEEAVLYSASSYVGFLLAYVLSITPISPS